jgi:hypothetical protein
VFNLHAINWRLSHLGFSARVWLCPDCWAKLKPFLTDEDHGTLVLRWDSPLPEVKERVIRFTHKGSEDVEAQCPGCGKILVSAEEVWLSTD